jgi:nitrosocyanin
MRRTQLPIAVLLAALALVPSLARAEADTAAPDRKITLVNLQYEGTKIWLPATVVVKKGERVELTLINNAPSGQHGFSIPAFDVAVIVEKGTPGHATFTADREGIFPIICQLHPAHVGGQLVVLP